MSSRQDKLSGRCLEQVNPAALQAEHVQSPIERLFQRIFLAERLVQRGRDSVEGRNFLGVLALLGSKCADLLSRGTTGSGVDGELAQKHPRHQRSDDAEDQHLAPEDAERSPRD